MRRVWSTYNISTSYLVPRVGAAPTSTGLEPAARLLS
jgi:hypothetical protein